MLKKMCVLVLAGLLLLPSFAGCAEKGGTVEVPDENGIVLYVAPDGDDTAAGTEKAPLATLAGAREKVRTLLPAAEEPVTVLFREGDYIMTEGVTFGEDDSGTGECPVTYKAFPGETVRFIGGVKVDPSLITKAEGEIADRVKDEAARNALLQADVSSLVDVYPELYAYGKEADDAEHPVEIYLGETPIVPARWPNRGGDYDYNYLDTMPDIVSYDDGSCDIFYDDETAERVNGWSEDSVGNMYLFGFFPWTWLGGYYAPDRTDRAEHSMHIPGSIHKFFCYMEGNCRYYFMNIPEEIDLPGESYVDRNAKVAYFYPTEDFDPDDVWISTLLEPMITLSGVSHVTFEGLDFRYTRGHGVYADGAEDMIFLGCRIAHVSSRAMRIWNAMRFRIDGCEIYDSNEGGIMIEGGDRKNLISSECVITNCDISNVCRAGQYWDPEVPEYDGGTYLNSCIGGWAVGLEISHNRLHDMPLQVIALTSNDIVVEYNEIYDCVRETTDMNAVGAWKNPTILGLVIRYNWFHDIGNAYQDGGQHAIYIDDGAPGAEIYGNLFTDAGGHRRPTDDSDIARGAPILLHSSQFNHIYNNVFVDSQGGVRFSSWSTVSKQGEWLQSMYGRGKKTKVSLETYTDVGYDSDLWRSHYAGTIWEKMYDCVTTERYAEFQPLTDKEVENKCRGLAPYLTNEVDGNVFVNILKPIAQHPVNDHDNFVSDDKAVFTDAEHGDYRLTAEGLALILETVPGFTELPLGEIGIRK